MSSENQLNRFTEAQQQTYDSAVREIRNGRKQSHWMWFIFPQIRGLGHSSTAKFYAILDRQEAADYLRHPVLGSRLETICNALLQLKENNANRVFGTPDDLKLKSSMTLFAALPEASPVFQQVLDKFFNGAADGRTLDILGQ